MSRASDLKTQIFKCDPYEGFDTSQFVADPHGWFDNESTFRALFEQIRPQTVIEVGVWLGKSLRWQAQWMKDNVEDPVAIGIDNFQGSIEHWGGTLKAKTKLGGLRMQNGFPMFYFQFMANTIFADLQDVIVPFPTSSLTAMRYLEQHGVKAEVVFVDASHQHPEVYDDLVAASKLMKDHNSIIIGDDLSPWFPEVGQDLKKFMADVPGWRMVKDGFGFVLIQEGNTLGLQIPKKNSTKDAKKAKKLAALNKGKKSDGDAERAE